MRVVISGVGGFVGKTVGLAFARAGHDVLGVFRRSYPKEIEGMRGITLVQADLRDCSALPSRFDWLVHCAADVPALCPLADELYTSNVEGTRVLFDHAAAAGARRIIFLSSMSVYGRIRDAAATEATPIDCPDVYGRSKHAGEQSLAKLVETWRHIAALVLRLPAVVGRGARHNFLADTLARVMTGAIVQARYPDAPFNNVVHVADLASFILSYCEDSRPGYWLSNIAAKEPLTIREVVGLLFQCCGQPERVNYVHAGKAPFTISLERVCTLGFRPRSVRDTLTTFVDDSLR